MRRYQEIRKQFSREIDLLNTDFSPLRAALILARADEPELNIGAVDSQVQDWADRYAAAARQAAVAELTAAGGAAAAPAAEPYQKLKQFNQFFFEVLGFKAARTDGAALSSLQPHRVIALRRGRPIGLALVYRDLARRLRIPLRPLAVPGHVLFASAWLDPEHFVDPGSGAIIDLGEAQRQIDRLFGSHQVQLLRRHLEEISDRRLLERYMVNLKGTYLANGQPEEALRVADWRLLLDGCSESARVERGLLLYDMNRFAEADKDLGLLLRDNEDNEDEEVEEHLFEKALVCAFLASLAREPRA